MQLITGTFSPDGIVGTLREPSIAIDDLLAQMQFTAEADPSATGPCFQCVGPTIHGFPLVLRATPEGTVANHNLTISDGNGGTWTKAVTGAGTVAVDLSDIGPVFGPLTFSADDFGAGERRMKYTIIVGAVAAP